MTGRVTRATLSFLSLSKYLCRIEEIVWCLQKIKEDFHIYATADMDTIVILSPFLQVNAYLKEGELSWLQLRRLRDFLHPVRVCVQTQSLFPSPLKSKEDLYASIYDGSGEEIDYESSFMKSV